MAFTINQTGIERGATQLVFPSPVIILDRDAEGSPTTTHEVSITGAPVVQQWTRDQDKVYLRLRAPVLTEAQVVTLRTLRDGGPVTVKLTPGSATTSTAIIADADMQEIEPLIGEHPNADSSGATLHANLTRYRADITLIRLE